MAGAIDTSRFKSNAQLDAHAAEQATRDSAIAANNQPVMLGLAAHVQTCWQDAKRAKDFVTPRLLSAQRVRAGQYDPAVLAEIREFGGSEEYARITANKIATAKAWLRDVFIGQTEKPWTLAPTPKPEMPEETMSNIKAQVAAEFVTLFAQSGMPVDPAKTAERMKQLTEAEQQRLQEQARDTSANMERAMYDQMLQGGWVEAMGEFLDDVVTFPSAHFKAPVFRKRPVMEWGNETGRWAPQVADKVIPEFERMDPFRCFPSPGSTSPQDGYFIELVSLSRGELYDLIGVEGFSEDAIRMVLDEYGRGGLTDWTAQSDLDTRSSINGEQTRQGQSTNILIDAISYSGPVQGRQLVEWGMDIREVTDPDADYEACVWLIGRWVIKAQLNYDPLKRRNIFKASYEELPGSYWGNALPDLLADMQGIANAGVRAMVNDMAMSSGPQVGINVDRLPANEDLTKIHPYKIWQFNESQVGSNTKAIEFFQPQSNAGTILGVIEKAYSFADDFSLIPRVMTGDASAGSLGRTASGISMVLNAANKGLKGVVSNIDVKIMTPQLEALFNYNMIYNPDETIKGDSKVVARGAVSLMQLETLQLRRNEFLVATNNPTDAQIVGPEGRAEILRETAKGLQMDVNRVIPPRGSVVPQQPMAQPGQQQAAPQEGKTLADGTATTDNFSPATQ